MGEKLGNLFRSWKSKKSPVTAEASLDYSEEGHANSESTLVNDSLTQGIYNVFGVPLEQAAKINNFFECSAKFTPANNSWESSLCAPEYVRCVPKMVLKCIHFINSYGLKEEGLYRVSGSGQEVKDLKYAFSQHGPEFDIPPTTDVHAVTSLIKAFARELPEELLPVKHCHTFLAYTKAEVPSELQFAQGPAKFSIFTAEEEDMDPVIIPTQILQEILQNLTPCQFALVQTLTRHFSAVVQNSHFNRMTLSSLALILCPTFKIHRSVFHALILKPQVWDNLHPSQSAPATKSVKYDYRSVVRYHQEQSELRSMSMTEAKSTSSSTFCNDQNYVPSIEVSEMFAYDSTVENKAQLPTKYGNRLSQRSSILFRVGDEKGDDLFDYQCSHQLELNKLHPEPVYTPVSSSISSFSDSSSRTSHSSDIDYSEISYHPAPQFTSKHEYRYRQQQPLEPSIPKLQLRLVSSVSNNRKLFLGKTLE